MKQKKLILIVTAIMFCFFVAVSPAQAVVDPITLSIVGFASLISLIFVDKTVENSKNDTMAKANCTEENKLILAECR